MTASVPTWTPLCLSIAHECTPVARPGLSVDVWFCCRRKAVRLSVLVLQPQPGGRNRGRGGQLILRMPHPARFAAYVYRTRRVEACRARAARILMMRAFNPNVDLSARIVHNMSSLPHIESGHSQGPSR